jgi:hypothetical protein
MRPSGLQQFRQPLSAPHRHIHLPHPGHHGHHPEKHHHEKSGHSGGDTKEVEKIQEANKHRTYIQGTRAAIPSGSGQPFNIQLLAPGKRFLGITLIPTAGANISDMAVTFSINNNVILNALSASMFVPTSMLMIDYYYPVPEGLTGKDTVQFQFNSQGATPANTVVYMQAHYIPR